MDELQEWYGEHETEINVIGGLLTSTGAGFALSVCMLKRLNRWRHNGCHIMGERLYMRGQVLQAGDHVAYYYRGEGDCEDWYPKTIVAIDEDGWGGGTVHFEDPDTHVRESRHLDKVSTIIQESAYAEEQYFRMTIALWTEVSRKRRPHAACPCSCDNQEGTGPKPLSELERQFLIDLDGMSRGTNTSRPPSTVF
mmetsp:Transcript_37415/g.69805  ORF Transcript_37415/g.69805 Transcript_37415/m.69805 type:complete len:195 (-) Transcript_37415:56-640(-)